MGTGYETIEHTADMGLHVWADSERGLFEMAARGMLAQIVKPKMIKALEKKIVYVEAENLEELFLKWLKEILFILEKFSFAIKGCRVEEINLTSEAGKKQILRGVCSGEKINPTRHDICNEIKAVTRHDFHLEKQESLWEARILFDV